MKNRKTIINGLTAGYENARINALHRYGIADSVPEEIFDHYVQMLTLIFGLPAAIIAFVDRRMVHYKASIGIGEIKNHEGYTKTCAKTINARNHIYIANLADTGRECPPGQEPVCTFYAGTPIITPDGYPIGCLGLLDHHTHQLTAGQLAMLKIFAAEVMDAVEARSKKLSENHRNNWLLKTTREALWEWDINEDKIWWNPAFSLLFGYPPPDTGHYDLNFWCECFDESFLEIKIAMRSFTLDGEHLFKRIDRSDAHVLIRSELIRDEFEKPVKMIGSILDISDRFIDEELHRKYNLELMRNKDEFISIASHEIKTPITIIKSYAQLIRKQADPEIDKNRNFNVYAERIQNQTDKLLKLVENLLDISRINFGEMTIYPEPFDFSALLDQVIEECDTMTGTHFIEKNGDRPLVVYADKFRIGQVLTNLVTNAIKYSPGAEKIAVHYYKNITGTATICVQDFGKGIAAEDQVKLFQKFYRVANLETNKIPGTGLGLNIAMEIVKLHGSTIKLDSKIGKGSMFSFDLPLRA